MIGTYLNNQNVSNNIIIQKVDDSNKQKRIMISSEKSISYSSSVDDKNETIDNQINDSTSSFDYSDTLRVSELPKKETQETFFEKSKNFLGFLGKAVSEFDIFNLSRKTNINSGILDKNKKNSNLSFKRSISGGKFQERIKKSRFTSSSVNKSNIINRIKASKIPKNNDNELQNKRITKVIKLSGKEKGINKCNKDKNSIDKLLNKKKNYKICKNININLNPKNSKYLTSKNNIQFSNDINNLSNINFINTKYLQEKHESKNYREIKQSQTNSVKNLNNKNKIKQLIPDDLNKINSHQQEHQHPRLTCIEKLNIKNIDTSPRLTNSSNFFHENMSSQNLFQNKNKQINLDIKYNHTQSKSPKNFNVKKLFPPQNNPFKQRMINNNSMNRQSVSPNPIQFGRQSMDNKRNNLNNINDKNAIINNMNNLCTVKKINGNLNLVLNNFNLINNSDKMENNLSNQRIQNSKTENIQNNLPNLKKINYKKELINNFPKLSKDSAQNLAQQRLTVSTPSISNLALNDTSVYTRLTNVPNQATQAQVQRLTQTKDNIGQINLNISLSPIINNYQNYIISEDPNSNTKKNFNITYNSFDATGVLKNYGILTLPGKDTSGMQKTNQDSFTFITNINNIKNFNIFGVLDGHGIEGHYVSQFASKFIPYQIMNNPEIKNIREPELIYNQLKKNNYQIIVKAYLDCDMALQKVNFDSKESGCTCNLIINIGNHIICANTGDSRAIAVSDESKDWNINYKYIPLSIDFKPEMPEEMNRILLNGGEVHQIKNELGVGVGPYRVWKRGEGYPGLAMSRSIGDLNGKKIGVIPNPGIIEYQINENSKYIVVCSDGVWEFLDNENVKDIGKKYYVENDPSGFCHDLVNTSYCLWEKNDIVIDDITAVVAFF